MFLAVDDFYRGDLKANLLKSVHPYLVDYLRFIVFGVFVEVFMILC